MIQGRRVLQGSQSLNVLRKSQLVMLTAVVLVVQIKEYVSQYEILENSFLVPESGFGALIVAKQVKGF